MEALGARIEEHIARLIWRRARFILEYLAQQGTTDTIGGDQVHTAVANKGRRRDRIQQPLQARLYGVGVGTVVARPATGKLVQVETLGIVEVQRASESVQHAVRGTAEVPALQPHVVVDADPGKHGDLLAAQPWDATLIAADRQAGHFRGQPSAT